MTTNQKTKTHDHGMLAEAAAELFLRAKGYKILARRYKTKGGEIDLVAFDGHWLVFAEVKARPSTDEGLYAITPKARRRIADAALHFISAHDEYADKQMRFDVIAVALPFKIRHLENAWMVD